MWPIMSTYMCEFVIVYICVDLYLDINNECVYINIYIYIYLNNKKA